MGSRWCWADEDARDHERRSLHEAPAREEQADASERPEEAEELGAAVVDLRSPGSTADDRKGQGVPPRVAALSQVKNVQQCRAARLSAALGSYSLGTKFCSRLPVPCCGMVRRTKKAAVQRMSRMMKYLAPQSDPKESTRHVYAFHMVRTPRAMRKHLLFEIAGVRGRTGSHCCADTRRPPQRRRYRRRPQRSTLSG